MRNFANNRSEASEVISDVSKQEGGTTKGYRTLSHLHHYAADTIVGSTSAQMQSNLTKQRNAQQAEDAIGAKIANDPYSITAEDAEYVHSRESRALGGQQPPSGSLASQAQQLAAKNQQGAPISGQSTAGPVDPIVQSHLDRQKNFEEAAGMVKQKMEQDPTAVTKEDGDLMHSREQKAFGTTEKGGLASQAQKLANKNKQ